MYEIRRTAAARDAEQAMPESLSVAFGAYLDELAADPWSAGEPWPGLPGHPVHVGTFGFNGRGIALYRIDESDTSPHVVLVRLTY